MEKAAYYRCADCGYEFLSRRKKARCPKCGSDQLEVKDTKVLMGFDEVV